MLKVLKFAQFSGSGTEIEGSNAGIASARNVKNFILRPLGGLGVPPAWSRFSPGGVALDLSYFTNVDFAFTAAARLLLQSVAGSWWDVTPNPFDGQPRNVTVATPSTTLSANLTVAAGKVMAFYNSTTGYIRLGADDNHNDWFTEGLGFVPFQTTTYSTDQAFTSGFGPVLVDGSGNSWKLQADDDIGGLYAVTI